MFPLNGCVCVAMLHARKQVRPAWPLLLSNIVSFLGAHCSAVCE